MWRLVIVVSPTALDVVATSTVADNSLIWRNVRFGNADGAEIRAIKDMVGKNPVLAGEFSRTDILVDTPRFMTVPPETARDADATARIFADLYPNDDLEIVVTPTGAENDPYVAMAVDKSLYGYVNRTFDRPRISHRIAPLARFYGMKSRFGNTGKLHAFVTADSLTLIAYGSAGLLMANTFAIENENDALYYTLAAARNLAFDADTDSVQVAGNAAMRRKLLPLLQKYIATAMPAIFPAALMRSGGDAMEAPFEAVVLPLCP